MKLRCVPANGRQHFICPDHKPTGLLSEVPSSMLLPQFPPRGHAFNYSSVSRLYAPIGVLEIHL